ncbi:MAG TPA: hypothetical protein VLI45_00665 [Acidobacteriaceae bacterium]|nr:hypothetical protein [Acidobacteriaceae bacterium]
MSLDLELAVEHTVRQPPTDAEKRALAERIAASTLFRRSVRLRDFLLYVTRQEIRNPSVEVHEQEIGAKVFGRSPVYDTGQDNIVRVNATELRKRIELYFSTEGADESLVVAIPRGSYMPVFSWRAAEVHQPPAASLAVIPPETVTPFLPGEHPPDKAAELPSANTAAPSGWMISTAILALACTGLLIALIVNRQVPDAQRRPTVMAFWTDFVRKGQTDMVLPDESISVMEDILKRPLALGEYLDRSYITGLVSAPMSDDRKADVRELLNHNLVTLGSVNAAKQILLLPGLAQNFHLTVSRFYPADDIKRNNTVFIGGKKSNPWVSLFEGGMNFTVDYDSSRSQAFVTNHHPRPGEQAIYTVSMGRNALTGYSVVAYLPNQTRTGKVVILAGTDSDATAAAAEYVTSEEQLGNLKNQIHASRLPYFEVLLKTSRLSGTSLGSEVVAYRTYGSAH